MTRSLTMIPDAELSRASSSPIADDEPGFGALRTEKGHLPLEAMDVRGRIDGLLARVVVRQTFVNAFDDPLEAAYIFPLPDRAAVTRFRMMVAGREIEGVLEERGRAREHYDQAIAEGRRASIAEEDRPGVFNLRVGNIMPGERATVELTLCGTLPYADGEATFRFPLVVAPRYIPGRPLPGPSVGDGTAVDTDAVPDASRISPPVLLPGFPNPVRLGIEVELHDGAAGADDVRSSLHAVEEEKVDGYRRIRIQPGERLDRDFILRFRLGGDAICSTLTIHPDTDGREQGTFALTIVPPAGGQAAPVRPRDVVFLLDRSGSMEGWKIVAARRALARMIDTLGEADRFAVLAFDSVVESPKSVPAGLAPAGDRNRFRAVEYLATVDARGGTEMAEPLDRAVKLLSKSVGGDRERILVLITDGQVGHEDQILAALGKRLRGIRVHTIGIDRAVNEGFLRRLAERGGGSCELVESEDRLDEVMTAIHRRIGTPLLSGLSLEGRNLSMDPGEVVPRRLPDLFAGSPLLVLGRYRGRPQGEIAVHGTGAEGKGYSESVPAAVRENPAIAAAWARGQIRQLEDRYAAGDGDRSTLEKAIVAISLRYQVLCRFTAYVAIDRSEVANAGGEVHHVTQPVETPAGWAPTHHARMRRMRGPAGGGGARGPAPATRSPGGYDAASRDIPCPAMPPMACAAPPSAMDGVSPIEEYPGAPLPSGPEPFMEREMAPDIDELTMVLNPEFLVDLAFQLRNGPRMKPREAAELIAEAADELRRLHDRGRVHGELDVAKMPRSAGPGASIGIDECREWCACFTPPERLRRPGSPWGPASDIYVLGVVLYLLLTGEVPGGKRIRPRRIEPSIPAKLEAICMKAIAKDPATRHGTARELAEALREFLKPGRKAFWK